MKTRHFQRVTVRVMALPILAVSLLAIERSTPQAALQWFTTICSAASGPMFSTGPDTSAAASRPHTTIKLLSCEPIPDVPGKSITTMIVDFPPMAYTPAHRHPGSVTAVVLEGAVRSQMEGSPAADYQTGQTWFEPPRALHMFAENPDPVHAAKLLATFVADSVCGPLVLPPDN